MKVLDPGHYYELKVLDSDTEVPMHLRFVKREGPGYPGNVGHYPGTTMQEVLRAVVQRLEYVEQQVPDPQTEIALGSVKYAIWALECRAARRHGRDEPTLDEALYGDTCGKCNHVGCTGSCH